MRKRKDEPEVERFDIAAPDPEPWFPVATEDDEPILDLREAVDLLAIEDGLEAERSDASASQPAHERD